MSEISIRSREGRISHSFAGCSATAFWLMAFKMRCAVFLYEKRPSLVTCLRHQKNKYRKKRGSWARIERNKAMKIKRITERPPIVEERSRIGDWEGDTIVGKEKTQRILTYVERKSRFGMENKRHTLTRDNGPEFGDYDRTLEKKTGMDVYRATPYHSWERGTDENWNGLMRQFFPKRTFFATITEYDVQRAVRMLNDRPRKRLGYKTPREVFGGCYDSD